MFPVCFFALIGMLNADIKAPYLRYKLKEATNGT